MRAKWTIDHDAVDRARKHLGIECSVTIDNTWVSWWYGELVMPLHTIRVSTLTPYGEVTPTIWHEMGHALQVERDYGGDYVRHSLTLHLAYLEADILHGKRDKAWEERYFAIPMEREAEDLAETYGDKFPLIKS